MINYLEYVIVTDENLNLKVYIYVRAVQLQKTYFSISSKYSKYTSYSIANLTVLSTAELLFQCQRTTHNAQLHNLSQTESERDMEWVEGLPVPCGAGYHCEGRREELHNSSAV